MSVLVQPTALPKRDGYEVRVATLEEFRASRESWNRLVFSMALPSIFLTWEWIYTWWERFGAAGREALILLVYGDGELRGILPLFREEGYPLIGSAFVWFCAAKDLYSDHLDIIAAPEHASACLAAVGEFFTRHCTDWAMIQFPMITADSAIYRWLSQGEHSGGYQVQVSLSSVARYIPLDGSFEEYFASFHKKQRYNVRSRRSRLYTEDRVQYVGESRSAGRSLEAVFDLHRRRAVRKGIASSFGRPDVLAFHQAFIERAAPQQWVYFRFLESPKGVIAGAYNLVMGGRVFSYQKGIDPAWERLGPGTVLLYELVQEAFAQGLKEYNFLQGAEAYKTIWTQHSRNLHTAQLYNRSAAGRLAAYLHRSKRLAAQLVKVVRKPKDS